MSLSSFRAAFGLAALATVAGLTFAAPADAQSIQKQCSTKYQAAKAAGTLSGMSYRQYYSKCAAEAKAGGAPAATPTAAPAAPKAAAPVTTATAPAPAPLKPRPAPTAAATGGAVFPTAVSPSYTTLTAGKARMKTCLDQYNANKATNGNGGLKWIQKGGGYYSECNKHLKS